MRMSLDYDVVDPSLQILSCVVDIVYIYVPLILI